jgi:hypothetical protein
MAKRKAMSQIARPLKVRNRPDFLRCRWRAKCCWKFRWGLQLCFRPHLNWKSAQKITHPQSRGNPNFGNFRTPKTKCHLDVGFVAKHKVYHKGEGGGFPQVRAVVSLVSASCSWLILTPKVLQLCTNQLVFGFVQVHVSSWCLSFFLVPSHSSNTPMYPQSATS